MSAWSARTGTTKSSLFIFPLSASAAVALMQPDARPAQAALAAGKKNRAGVTKMPALLVEARTDSQERRPANSPGQEPSGKLRRAR